MFHTCQHDGAFSEQTPEGRFVLGAAAELGLQAAHLRAASWPRHPLVVSISPFRSVCNNLTGICSTIFIPPKYHHFRTPTINLVQKNTETSVGSLSRRGS